MVLYDFGILIEIVLDVSIKMHVLAQNHEQLLLVFQALLLEFLQRFAFVVLDVALPEDGPLGKYLQTLPVLRNLKIAPVLRLKHIALEVYLVV